MDRTRSGTPLTRIPRREIHEIPFGGRPDLAALVPALGLVPGVNPFVLLDGEGWDLRALAFDPEYTLTVGDASPFEKLRDVLAPEERAGDLHPSEGGPALFGYLYYDAARYLERLPTLAKDHLELPIGQFILPRCVVGLGPAEEAYGPPSWQERTQTLSSGPSVRRRRSPMQYQPIRSALYAPAWDMRGICGRWRG